MPGLFEPPDIFEKAAVAIGGVRQGLENVAGAAVGFGPGYDPYNPARTPPTANGGSTRQSQVRSGRPAVTKRQAMRFIVPEQPIVEMYVNPQQVQYQYSKLINSQRAKGGYILQYWGENLGTLNVSGTTGTSGIEGINVLYDIYRNEQLMFDPYALMLEAERDRAEQQGFDNLLFGDGGTFGLGNTLFGQFAGLTGDFLDSAQNQNIISSRNKPTLAQLAFTVEIYWFGEVYRGYFENFNFTESATNLGLFDYSFTFKVTQKRGFRTNFLAWHKDPNEGQSNWGSGGPSKSYSYPTLPAAPTRGPDQQNIFQSISNGINQFASNQNQNTLNNAVAVSTGLISPFNIL